MKSNEIRARFLKFFEKRGHKIIPSASLVPENDPSVLFNTAGMQPLVPYLLGEEHPMGKRIVDIQKCVRTGDLDDIGDNRHFSFFEMMGNWSLGDYFKEDAIKWSYDFLTSKEEGLGLDPKRLYVTCFEGDENAPKDTESAKIWEYVGIPKNRVYFLGVDDNWWAAGDNGPCGPDTEMFYDMAGGVGDLTQEQFLEAVKKEKVIELWNDVFMEYEKKDGKVIGKLKQKNVDTGAGLERITAVMQGKQTAYDTDLFIQIIKNINFLRGYRGSGPGFDKYSHESDKNYHQIVKAVRVVADHTRASVFMIADGTIPSNKDRGYILRRLIRRAIKFGKINLKLPPHFLFKVSEVLINQYKEFYPELETQRDLIQEEIVKEEHKFSIVVDNGYKELKKIFNRIFGNIDPDDIANGAIIKNNTIKINGKELFNLYQTFGFPIELSQEIMEDWGLVFDKETIKEAKEEFKKHQEKSRTSSAGMFKGGLANHNEKTIKLHTAHHLLLAGLQAVVDKNIKQRGSNITEERLRIDFLCDHKLTDEEKKKAEDWVNDKIARRLDVVRKEMPFSEAESIGAEMEFGAKYADIVSVYFIQDKEGNIASKEFCGGPHVKNTSELGRFKIQKEEAVAQGIRRIKAVLE
ncbi:MAG TPA: alanine--tRNA ligase [Candidatus Paceibacterota bacterium]